MKVRALLGVPLLLVFCAGCGGISHSAKVATAIQTLMAASITSFASKSSSSLSISYKCGKTDEDGTLTYEIPSTASLLQDPLKLIDYVRENPDGLPLSNVTFSNCVIKACGEELVVNGPAKLLLAVQPSVLLASGGDTSKVPARFQLTLEETPVSGLASGTWSFAYIIEATYTTDSLESIKIIDSPSPHPLETDGTSYPAKNIEYLADGC